MRDWLCRIALVFQAWNCQDIFFMALAVLEHDLAPLTAYSADTACQPLVSVIPKFVGELLHPVSATATATARCLSYIQRADACLCIDTFNDPKMRN